MNTEHAPEIGDVVHYVTRSGVHAPADVCVVHANGTLDLFVKDAPMNFACFRYNVRHNAHGRALCWHWPEHLADVAQMAAELRDVMSERTSRQKVGLRADRPLPEPVPGHRSRNVHKVARSRKGEECMRRVFRVFIMFGVLASLSACAAVEQTTVPSSAGGGAPWDNAPGGDVTDLPPGDLRGIAVNFAVAQDGKPYTQWPNNPALSCGRGSATCTRTGPDCFDCSGLTQTAYKQAGITLGPTTYYQINDGVPVSCSAADLNGTATTCWQPGDLALFLDRGDPYHVAMYAGGGFFIEALNCGDGVMYWQRPASTMGSINVRRIVDVDGRTLLGGA